MSFNQQMLKYIKIIATDVADIDANKTATVSNNITELGGHAINLGTGIMDTGTIRTTIATDDPSLTNIYNATVAVDTNLGVIDSRLVSSNSMLNSIQTNTNNTVTYLTGIKTDTDSLYNCIDHVNNHVEVDTNAINGVLMAVGSGVNGTGVQRMTIATDDNVNTKLQTISTNTAPLATNIDGFSNFKVNMAGINGLSGVSTDTGVSTTTTQRVTIATDDIINSNLAAIGASLESIDTSTANAATSLASIDTTLTNIYTILNHVYSGGLADQNLRTHAV